MLAWIAPFAIAVTLVLPSTTKDELSIRNPLGDEDIAQALALGKDVSRKLPRLSLGSAGANFGGMRDDSNRDNNFMQPQKSVRTTGFGVEIYTPYAWIAKLSRAHDTHFRQVSCTIGRARRYGASRRELRSR